MPRRPPALHSGVSSSSPSLSSPSPPSSARSTEHPLPPPPPSPGRLARVLRVPHAIVPSQRSTSLQNSAPAPSPAFVPTPPPMGATVSQHQPPPEPSSAPPPQASSKPASGRLRRVFAPKRKKGGDGHTQLAVANSTPLAPTVQPRRPRAATTPIPRPPATTMSELHDLTLAGEHPVPAALRPLPLPKSPRMMSPPPAPSSNQVDATAALRSALSDALAPAHPSVPALASVSAPEPAPASASTLSSDSFSLVQLPALEPAADTENIPAPVPVGENIAAASAQPQPQPQLEPESEPEPKPDEATPAPASRPHMSRQDTAEHDNNSKTKEDWRKSDATMSSYHTVRPASGARTRPVSMADSLQSTSTIVANAKRLSALITDAEFVMAEAEEDSASASMSMSTNVPPPRRAPSSGAKARKRHSISLHFTAPFQQHQHTVPAPPPAPMHASSSITRTAASGIIGAAQNDGSSNSPAGQIRGRLAAWSTSPPDSALPSPHSGSTSNTSTPPPPPGPAKWQPQPQPPVPSPIPASHARPAHTTQQGGMFGFGKRAVERMGRAFGGLGSNGHSGGNGGLAAGAATAASMGGAVGYHRSAHSSSIASVPDDWNARGARRTPNAPSGSWSIASTTSDVDGPGLGERMRPPRTTRGLVFAQPLALCVRHTALEPVRVRLAADGVDPSDSSDLSPGVNVPLEERRLPALVVRCAQHILKWGLEEEGLFRISGRASHVAKLRVEFDTGADFDLRECPPGDLDPHAVASIFKAYLRELPEPILTKELNPLFEAAMAAETEARLSSDGGGGSPAASPRPDISVRRSALPANPRDGRLLLLKPPSLTTLALPNFASMRPPSARLLRAFAALIARLPRAHRDLLRTVTELIRATANRPETRMPLSNLTVVFCPSLAMSPPILRVLCESKEIWYGVQEPEDVEEEKDAEKEQDERETLISADDSASYVSCDAQRDPWPPLSSPSSSSLATPNDDTASSVGPPVVPQEDDDDDELDAHVAGALDAPALKTPAAHAFPSFVDIAPPPPPGVARRLASISSSSSSLGSPEGLRTRRLPSISAPLHLPPRAATAPGTPVCTSPTILPMPLERQKRPSLTALFAKRSLSSLRSSRAFSRSFTSSGSASPAPLSPDGTMVTAQETLPPPSPSSPPPTLEVAIATSPLAVPVVLRQDDDVESSVTRAGKVVARMRPASASSPNLTTPALPTTASSAIEPISHDIAAYPSQVGAKTLVPGVNLRGLTPLIDLPSPYNRLSLWEDSGDEVVDGDWASSVLLAADESWLGVSH